MLGIAAGRVARRRITVIRTLSVALAASVVVRVQIRVPTVQIKPPSVSVIAVAVRPAGKVTLSVVALLSATVSLVSVTATVMVSSVSPSSIESPGPVVMAHGDCRQNDRNHEIEEIE